MYNKKKKEETYIMNIRMTDQTTTSYSALANRDYTRKVYPLNNSENYYRPRYAKKILACEVEQDFYAMQKTPQTQKGKKDPIYKSVNIESVASSSEFISDDIHSRIEDESDAKNLLNKVLSTLNPREERVLRMRFGIGMSSEHTLEEVGQQFSCTRGNIALIQSAAMRKLKCLLKNKKIDNENKGFLDV